MEHQAGRGVEPGSRSLGSLRLDSGPDRLTAVALRELRRSPKLRERGAGLSLWALLTLVSACAPDGLAFQVATEADAVTFLVRHDDRIVFGVERLGADEDSGAVFSAHAGEQISVVSLDSNALASVHVAADASRVSEVDLEPRNTAESCRIRVDIGGTVARTLLPSSASVRHWTPERELSLTPGTLPPAVHAALNLRTPLGPCMPKTKARPFAKDGYVLESPFFLDGAWREAGSVADVTRFRPLDATYIDSDTVMVVFRHGLVRLGRGERIESVADPRYFGQDVLPDARPDNPWQLTTASYREASTLGPSRLFVAADRKSAVQGVFESIAALISIDGNSFQVLSSTVTAGVAGSSGLDPQGRFFVAMSEGPSERPPDVRKGMLFVDPENVQPPFRLLTHEQEIRGLVPGTSAELPHALFTQRPSHLQLGDFVEGRRVIDEQIVLSRDEFGHLARSISVLNIAGRPFVAVGGERGELSTRATDGTWTLLEQHLDSNVRRLSTCTSSPDDCSNVHSPTELAEAWATLGPSGEPWVYVAPEVCPHALVARADGCIGLVEIDRPFVVDDPRVISVIRPASGGERAIVAGHGGLLVEIAR